MSDREKNKPDSTDLNSEENKTSVESNDTDASLSKLEKDLDIDDLPQEAKAIVRMMMSRSVSTKSSSFLEDKINSEHISTILNIAEEDNKIEFEDAKLVKLYNLITLVIILVFLGFLTIFLANKDLSTYQDIIRILPFHYKITYFIFMFFQGFARILIGILGTGRE